MSVKSLVVTKEQTEALEKLKNRVADLNEPVDNVARFLIARDYNLDRAETMLRKNISWRKENEVDDILNEFPEDCELRKELPYQITGYDHAGGPIIWAELGKWDSKKFIEEGRALEFYRWCIRMMEDALVKGMSVPNQDPHQGVFIIDAQHLHYARAMDYESLKMTYSLFQIMEQNYPETLKSILVVNTPWVFKIPYNFVKCILSSHTMSKVKIFSTSNEEWIEELLKVGKKENLPQKYFENE